MAVCVCLIRKETEFKPSFSNQISKTKSKNQSKSISFFSQEDNSQINFLPNADVGFYELKQKRLGQNKLKYLSLHHHQHLQIKVVPKH